MFLFSERTSMPIKVRKKWWIVACALIGAIAVVGLISLPPKEPVYQGKTVSSWFKELASPANPTPVILALTSPGVIPVPSTTSPLFPFRSQIVGIQQRDRAMEALLKLGPQAVPYLITVLQHKDGPVVNLYRRTFFNLRTRLPNVRLLPQPPLPDAILHETAASVLMRLGASAAPAIPALIACLQGPDLRSTPTVLQALRRLGFSEADIAPLLRDLSRTGHHEQVVRIIYELYLDKARFAPELGAVVRAGDPRLRVEALRLLERSGLDAKSEVPKMITALTDRDKEVRYLAARALVAVGTNAIPAKAALLKARQDESVLVRSAAKRALANLDPGDAAPAGVK